MADDQPINAVDILGITERLTKLQAVTEQTKRVIEQTQILTRLQLLGSDRIFSFMAFDQVIKMYIPFAGTDFIQTSIIRDSNFWEADLLKAVQPYLKPESVVVDAGANIGNHTLFFAMICRVQEVIAFEPMNITFQILQRNISLNALANVRAVNCALGAAEGFAELVHYWSGNMGGATLDLQKDAPSEKGGRGYPVRTIDSLSLERLDFLKIDVEGGHLSVIKGAEDTLRRCRPLLWIELREEKMEFTQGQEALMSRNYRYLGPIARSRLDHLFVAA